MIPNKIVTYLDELIPDPRCELNYNKDYELLIAVMLSAQTTDKRVNVVTAKLFQKYPNLDALANSEISDIIAIIRSLGSFNRKAINIKEIAISLKNHGGSVPNDREFLESLSGVCRKTTNVVLSNLYDVNVIAVDTHVNRVSVRLGIASEKDDVYMVEKKLNKFFEGYSLNRLHHQLVLFGRYYCKAKKPECINCHLKDMCKYK